MRVSRASCEQKMLSLSIPFKLLKDTIPLFFFNQICRIYHSFHRSSTYGEKSGVEKKQNNTVCLIHLLVRLGEIVEITHFTTW